MIFIILILSFIYSSSFLDRMPYSTTEIYNINNIDKKLEKDNHPLKYAFYSSLIPGTGEFILYKKHSKMVAKKRAMIFFGIEISSWISYLIFDDKYKAKINEYRDFSDSDIGWDFSSWIYHYNSFKNSDYSYLWEDPNGTWKSIGDGSHSISFYMGENLIKTTDNTFKNELFEQFTGEIEGGDNIYEKHSISILKDQHYYENIGKYNEFFSGWSDATTGSLPDGTLYINVIESGQGYKTARSPIKNQYLNLYGKAEEYSDFSEYSILCIYFNHFISMVDAFILARKFNGDVMLTSSTIYDKNPITMPIGVKVDLIFSL